MEIAIFEITGSEPAQGKAQQRPVDAAVEEFSEVLDSHRPRDESADAQGSDRVVMFEETGEPVEPHEREIEFHINEEAAAVNTSTASPVVLDGWVEEAVEEFSEVLDSLRPEEEPADALGHDRAVMLEETGEPVEAHPEEEPRDVHGHDRAVILEETGEPVEAHPEEEARDVHGHDRVVMSEETGEPVETHPEEEPRDVHGHDRAVILEETGEPVEAHPEEEARDVHGHDRAVISEETGEPVETHEREIEFHVDEKAGDKTGDKADPVNTLTASPRVLDGVVDEAGLSSARVPENGEAASRMYQGLTRPGHKSEEHVKVPAIEDPGPVVVHALGEERGLGTDNAVLKILTNAPDEAGNAVKTLTEGPAAGVVRAAEAAALHGVGDETASGNREGAEGGAQTPSNESGRSAFAEGIDTDRGSAHDRGLASDWGSAPDRGSAHGNGSAHNGGGRVGPGSSLPGIAHGLVERTASFGSEFQGLSGTLAKDGAGPQGFGTLPSAYRYDGVYDRFSQGLRLSLSGGGREVRVKLVPERLGELLIKLSVDEKNVSAKIVVESAAIKSLLESDAGKLRNLFAEQGLELDKYSVEVGARGPGAEGHDQWAPAGGHRVYADFERPRPEETLRQAPGLYGPGVGSSSARVDLFA